MSSEVVWSINPTKKLIIEGQQFDITGKTASEVKQLIMEEARRRGWSSIIVKIDGTPVKPEEFDTKFNTATRIEVERYITVA